MNLFRLRKRITNKLRIQLGLRQSYARRRDHLLYYKRVEEVARRYCLSARSVLEVGSADTETVLRLDWIPDKTVLDLWTRPRIKGVTCLKGDFMSFQAPRTYDLVVCLQVLEHLRDPRPFLLKLLRTGRFLVVSVPYKWPAGHCPSHIQDPVDESKLLSWAGQPWIAKQIVEEEAGRPRLVALFEGRGSPPVDD